MKDSVKTPAIMEGEFMPEGYSVPDKKKQFLKIKEGDNKIRVISPPLLGYVFFNKENKPVRKLFSNGDFSKEELIEGNCKKDEEGNLEGSRHFWALIVWDYKTETPKIWEVTQSTIMRGVESLSKDNDWGDPRGYDINIFRKGTGKLDTEFTVTPKPKKPLEKLVLEEINLLEENCNLNALMSGEYPFSSYEYAE